MSTHPNPIPVRLSWASPYKAPTVFLGVSEDEQVVTDASRVTVDCVAGEAPKIFLEFPGDQGVEDVKLEGVVYVVRETPADPLLAVQEFVGNLDADELNKAVLSVLELGPEETFAEAALKVLRGWAHGDQPGERTS